MRLLYTSEYKGDKICGVLTRVKNEMEYMTKQGHECHICAAEDFGPRFRISNNTSIWNFRKLRAYIKELKPDIIICNTYRHPETNVALKVANKLGIACCLVTHAPFLEPGIRTGALDIAASIYDTFFNRLNEYSKVITISKWETPYLLDLGLEKDKIAYLPNALPNKLKSYSETGLSPGKLKKILFLGRIAPIKDVPTLLRALSLLNKSYKLTLAGPFDKDYRSFLVEGMGALDIQAQTCFTGQIDKLKDKIEIIKQHDIFVLPSIREGMPQALLEAMALGKIVISSRTQGGLEIIKERENGFLFNMGNAAELAKKIELVNHLNSKELRRISSNAQKTAAQFAASNIYPKTEKLYQSLIKESKNSIIKVKGNPSLCS